MGLKHRGSSKIKYEHSMIAGLRKFLEQEIEPLPFVESIIPGAIKPKKGVTPGFRLKFQYPTKTGAKLIALSGRSAQEVFVVTSDPEKLRELLEGRFPEE